MTRVVFRGMSFAVLVLAGATALLAQLGPSESDMYCSGFFRKPAIPEGLSVEATEEVGFKNEFATGDYIYLNRGADRMTSTGARYMLVRPVRDVDRKEAYTGQALLEVPMGTLYAEIARIEVESLNPHTSTAKILSSCQAAQVGDIAVPMTEAPALQYKSPKITPRFLPLAANPLGTIVQSKDFDQALGEGKIIYLNIGTAQGLKPGSYLAVIRTYLQAATSVFGEATSEYPPDEYTYSTAKNQKMLHAQMKELPTEVLGEAMILSTEDHSATAIITYSRTDLEVGDLVEVE